MAVLLPLLFLVAKTDAQSTVRIDSGDAKISHAFSRILQAVELVDGRVLVLDKIESSINLTDSSFQDYRQVIRRGRGPGEVILPVRMIAIPDGRVVVVDRVGGRLVQLQLQSRTAPASMWEWADPSECSTPVGGSAVGLKFADVCGRLYSLAPPVQRSKTGALEIAKHSAIQAWRSPCVRDTAALVPADLPSNPIIVGGVVVGSGSGGTGRPAFPTREEWGVDSAGRVIVVSPEPYEIRVYERDGNITSHQIPSQRVPLTSRHKDWWRNFARAPAPAVVRTRGSKVSSSAMLTEKFVEPSSWPATLPVFLRDAVIFASDGTAWIRRTPVNEGSSDYDVVRPDGRLTRLVLPGNSRVVGVGERYLYLASEDDDGLEYLERVALSRVIH